MRRLPFLSNSDRRALLLLEWILMFIFLGILVYSWMEDGEPSEENGQVEIADSAKRSQRKTYTYAVPEMLVETFPFDPNTADSTTLLRLGLTPWQVRSIYKYRAMNGRYHTPDDFRRLPGITYEQWERLKTQIRIAKRFQYLRPEDKEARKPVALTKRDEAATEPTKEVSSLPSVDTVTRLSADTLRYPKKYPEGTLVDVNLADTNELKKIPGIASYRAQKIVEYRRKLGGYLNKEQVMEACEMPDEVLEWFTVCNPLPKKVNINELSIQRMMRHPYISFYQAKAIWEYRKSYGPIKSEEELLRLDGFTQDKLEKLRPYLEF